MAQLQQRVFMVFVRMYQTNSKGTVDMVTAEHLAWQDVTIQAQNIVLQKPMSQLTGPIGQAMNIKTTDPKISDGSRPFNANAKFNEDAWFLHSIWTSFDEMKKNVRPIINAIGLNNVLVGGYVDLDLELLPNK